MHLWCLWFQTFTPQSIDFLMAWVGSEKCNYVAITQYKELFSLKHNNIEKKVSKCSKGFKYSFLFLSFCIPSFDQNCLHDPFSKD